MGERKQRGRKRKNDLYFGPDEESAVIDFLSSTDHVERNRIYNDCLKKPLDKMIESIIRRYKLYRKNYSFDDIHKDTLSFLITKVDKFNPDKKKRSYSYFGTICKNYLLGQLIRSDKSMKQMVSYEDVHQDLEDNENFSYTIDEPKGVLTEFIDDICNSIREEIAKSTINDNEKKVGTALIAILQDWEIIFDGNGGSKYNKNAILSNIREMTLLSTKDIRIAMKRYKKLYVLIKEDRIDNGLL